MPQNPRPGGLFGDMDYGWKGTTLNERIQAQNVWDLAKAQEDANELKKQEIEYMKERDRKAKEEERWEREFERNWKKRESEIYWRKYFRQIGMNFSQFNKFQENILPYKYKRSELEQQKIDELDSKYYKVLDLKSDLENAKDCGIDIWGYQIAVDILLIPATLIFIIPAGMYLIPACILWNILLPMLRKMKQSHAISIVKSQLDKYPTIDEINKERENIKTSEEEMFKNRQKDFQQFRLSHFNEDMDELINIFFPTLELIESSDIVGEGTLQDYDNYFAKKNREFTKKTENDNCNSNMTSETNVKREDDNNEQNEIDEHKNYIIPPIELISNDDIIRDIIETEDFKNSDTKLISVLGKNETKENVIIDIEDSGHLLLIGNEHNSKKLYINALIASIMYKSKPNETKMIMINPNLEEANIYNEIPHLLIPTIIDERRAAGGLAWAVQEMENRYSLFKSENCINIDSYNERVEEKFPYLLIVINEIQDLIVNAKIDIEDAIYQLVQKGIKSGIYLVITTDETNSKTKNDKVNYAEFSKVIFKSLGDENIQISYLKGQDKIELQGATMLDKELNKVIQYTKNNMKGEL